MLRYALNKKIKKRETHAQVFGKNEIENLFQWKKKKEWGKLKYLIKVYVCVCVYDAPILYNDDLTKCEYMCWECVHRTEWKCFEIKHKERNVIA